MCKTFLAFFLTYTCLPNVYCCIFKRFSNNRRTSTTMKEYTDEQLVCFFVETQRNSFFEELYERYADKVYRKCLSFVKDKARAEDFTHDIFIKLILRVGSFKETAKFSTWLFSITYNYCIDQVRVIKKDAEQALEDDIEIIDEVEDGAEMEMEAQKLRQVLEKIAPDERTILLMKYQDDFSIKEIADTFGLTESAVKMRLKRTKEKLRKLYEENVFFWVILIAKISLIVKWLTNA
jgi:RNA polymerase sigma factor (sigma-70 family)